jgi:transcriptional regulator with XRE-family HTH domain
MGDKLTEGIETRNKALVRRLGALAKQRREELGFHGVEFAKKAGIESDKTIRDFEFGRSLPPADTRRKLATSLFDKPIRFTWTAPSTSMPIRSRSWMSVG